MTSPRLYTYDQSAFVVGPASNWAVLRDSDNASSWVLLDGGYPGDIDLVLETAAEAGAQGLPEAVLLTHAHIDHLGAALHLSERGVPVWCSVSEVGNATGASPSQIDAETALAKANEDGLWASWVEHVLAAGGLSEQRLSRSRIVPFAPENTPTLDLPGSPQPIATQGHTPGHCAFLSGNVLYSGDVVITGHPVSARPHCAQLLHPAFHSDPEETRRAAMELLTVDAQVLAPGHGDPQSMEQARADFSE